MHPIAKIRLSRALRRLEGTTGHLTAGRAAADTSALANIVRDAVASAAGAAGDGALAAAYAGGSLDTDAVAQLKDRLGETREALEILECELDLDDGVPPGRVLDCLRCVRDSLDDIRAVIGGPGPFALPPVLPEWQIDVCRPLGAYHPTSPAEAAAEAAAEPEDPAAPPEA